MEKVGKTEVARRQFVRALEVVPVLPEAHLALALLRIRTGKKLDSALFHLDSIVLAANSRGALPCVLGWRSDVLFKLGRVAEAFREMHTLLSAGSHLTWVWPWCARLVAAHGRSTVATATWAIWFWDGFFDRFPDHLPAQRERLLCIWYVHAEGGNAGCDYHNFKQCVADLVARGVVNPAFLWDLAGHWAQDEKDWNEAEECYREAFDLAPAEYGYCLGTALNFQGRYTEALPILLMQSRRHQRDAMSWFQVAIAREGIGDIAGCIRAYKRVLRVDADYAQAWFNLGGVYWNSRDKRNAISIWKEAMRRFPEHRLSEKLREDVPILRT